MKIKFRRTRAGIFGIISLLVCFMWGMVFFWSFSERERILDADAKILGQLRSALDEQTTGLFRIIELSLQASERWIADHPDSDPASAEEFIGLVDGFRKLSDNLVDIRIVSPSGGLHYIPKQSEYELANVSDREYFKVQLDDSTKGFYISQPLKSRVTNKWLVPISIPVNAKSKYVAVIFAAIELDRIAELHENSRIKPNGTITILSNKGQIIARAPFNEKIIGKSILSYSEFSTHMQKESGTFLTDGSATDGVTRLVSFSRLKSYPLVIAVSSAMKDVLAPWKKQTMTIIGLCFWVTVFVAFLWYHLLASIKYSEEAQAKLEFQAKIDALTGLLNRRAFLEELNTEIERSHRYSRSLSLLMIDVDYFKKVNDKYGHSAGDEVLRSMGKLFKDTIRNMDIAGRIGGEEFCVILPETDITSANDAAERIRSRCEDIRITAGSNEIKATLSIGISGLMESDITPESIMERADKALYLAKDNGRNRIETIIEN
ncbi:sensor domain-containing diguanylate cyclase [Desulforegula conservatrix]|uniref:sensor domain-containing diguanylate cyclase n=1 Tax=Desulforegula conservatrix TaxID=153026 RepID=UPI0004269DDE|nr:sensor domain-containing diguanylate cyclase [Desulforegula conservatrix]